MPRFSDDDVIDWLVCEAVVARAEKLIEEEQKVAERREWQKGAADLPG